MDDNIFTELKSCLQNDILKCKKKEQDTRKHLLSSSSKMESSSNRDIHCFAWFPPLEDLLSHQNKHPLRSTWLSVLRRYTYSMEDNNMIIYVKGIAMSPFKIQLQSFRIVNNSVQDSKMAIDSNDDVCIEWESEEYGKCILTCKERQSVHPTRKVYGAITSHDTLSSSFHITTKIPLEMKSNVFWSKSLSMSNCTQYRGFLFPSSLHENKNDCHPSDIQKGQEDKRSYLSQLHTDKSFLNLNATHGMLQALDLQPNMSFMPMKDPSRFYDTIRTQQSQEWASSKTTEGIKKARGGHHDAAIIEYDAALAMDVNALDALVGRGASYANKGRFDMAILDFEKALVLDPKCVNATEYLVATRRKISFSKIPNVQRLRPSESSRSTNDNAVQTRSRDGGSLSTTRPILDLSTSSALSVEDGVKRKDKMIELLEMEREQSKEEERSRKRKHKEKKSSKKKALKKDKRRE